jgi:hypothetical protein
MEVRILPPPCSAGVSRSNGMVMRVPVASLAPFVRAGV